MLAAQEIRIITWNYMRRSQKALKIYHYLTFRARLENRKA